jgi:hypothetical protein
MNKNACISCLIAFAFVPTVLAEPSVPKSAEVVDIPAKMAEEGIKSGNIKVTFSDGHSEIVTRQSNCDKPRVDSGGLVGWVHFSGLDRRNYALDDIVQLRLLDGSIKEFKPHPEAPFIQEWGFADNGSSIVIQSMQHHGPPYYIKYDIKSGRSTGTVNQYLPYDKLPKWAQPFSDEKP